MRLLVEIKREVCEVLVEMEREVCEAISRDKERSV